MTKRRYKLNFEKIYGKPNKETKYFLDIIGKQRGQNMVLSTINIEKDKISPEIFEQADKITVLKEIFIKPSTEERENDEFWKWFDRNMIYNEDAESFVCRLFNKRNNWTQDYHDAQNDAFEVVKDMKRDFEKLKKEAIDGK